MNRPPPRAITPPPQRWNWGSFLVYGAVCFFGGLCAGLAEVPGIIPVILGAVAGFVAVYWNWFEADHHP